MKRWISGFVCLVLAAAGGAPAQVDPGPDGVGLYYDLEATEYCLQSEANSVELHLIVTGCSRPDGIHGWSCTIDWAAEGTIFLYDSYLAGDGAINIYEGPDFSVGIPVPLPWSPAIRLATLEFVVIPPGCTEFFVQPCSQDLYAIRPEFVPGDEPNLTLPLYSSSGAPWGPVALLNCPDCYVVPAEGATFGELKSLYR